MGAAGAASGWGGTVVAASGPSGAGAPAATVSTLASGAAGGSAALACVAVAAGRSMAMAETRATTARLTLRSAQGPLRDR